MASASERTQLEWFEWSLGTPGEWVRGQSPNMQAAAGSLVVLVGCLLPLIVVHFRLAPAYGMLSILSCAVAAVIGRWFFTSWLKELPRRDQRQLTVAPAVVYMGAVVMFSAGVVFLGAEDRALASMMLLLVWACHAIGVSPLKPTRFVYDTLRCRLGWAAPLRVFTMWCALVGTIWLLHIQWGAEKYQGALIGSTITLGASGIAASLRVLGRTRRLRTELDLRASELTVALQEMRTLSGEDCPKQRFAVGRAWHAFRQAMDTRVDSGLSFSGVSVLPSSNLRALEEKVSILQRTDGADRCAYVAVVARLRMINRACAHRIDILA